jgi:hypothetical protein
VHPLLERIVRWGFFDTFEVEIRFLTGKTLVLDVGRYEVIGDIQKRIARIVPGVRSYKHMCLLLRGIKFSTQEFSKAQEFIMSIGFQGVQEPNKVGLGL